MKEPVKYRLYDTETKRDLGIYTGTQVAQKIDVKSRQLSAYAKSRSKLKGRYLVEKVENVTVRDLLAEWDRVTALFRKKRRSQ